MIFIGIEVGKKGGISVLSINGMIGNTESYPYDDKTLLNLLEMYKRVKIFCVVEKAHSMPKQGVKSTFDF